MGVGHQEVEGVRAEVESGDPHLPRLGATMDGAAERDHEGNRV
jgi:hypothetical protein